MVFIIMYTSFGGTACRKSSLKPPPSGLKLQHEKNAHYSLSPGCLSQSLGRFGAPIYEEHKRRKAWTEKHSL